MSCFNDFWGTKAYHNDDDHYNHRYHDLEVRLTVSFHFRRPD